MQTVEWSAMILGLTTTAWLIFEFMLNLSNSMYGKIIFLMFK